MTRPARYVLRWYVPDPRELDADSEVDTPAGDDRDAAVAAFHAYTARHGDRIAALVERVGIRWDPDTGWEFKERTIAES